MTWVTVRKPDTVTLETSHSMRKKMIETMKFKDIIIFTMSELGLSGLTWKQKAAIMYFILSLCALAIPNDGSIATITLIILNFLISALCVKSTGIKIKVD